MIRCRGATAGAPMRRAFSVPMSPVQAAPPCPQRIPAPECLYLRAQHAEVVANLIAVAEGKRGMETAPATDSVGADRREEFGRLAAAELSASYQLATRILGNRSEAEDAVNEAPLKAWSSFGRLRDTASFRPWFMRIVVNTCRNELRHKKVVRIEPLVGDDHPASDSFEGGPLRDVVSRAIDCLRPDQRVVVVLRYWNDLAVDEIARLLAIPSGTVKWRLHAANQRIKAELGRLGWEVEQ